MAKYEIYFPIFSETVHTMIIPYLTDPLLMLTGANRFFKPNQYLTATYQYLVCAYIVKATFNRS